MSTDTRTREVARIVVAHRQQEGAGFVVRRPVPGPGLVAVDPFLLIDEMGPVDYAPGQAVGAPDHPHRGFETVSYLIEGEVEHEDSAGHRGRLGPGDVQWMTAGAGIVHSEMPSRRIREDGGRVHGFQIWVNLPARKKMTTPRYQEVPNHLIPRARTEDGRVEIRVVAGEALGAKAVIDTHTEVVFEDVRVDEGGDVRLPIDPAANALVYVFSGAVSVGDEGTRIDDGRMALLGEGDAVRLRGVGGGGRMLLLAGVPHREPIARYGPFVMNTQQELTQAFRDYESGKMGEITRTAMRR